MTFSTPGSVVSGIPYTVLNVAGHPCEQFDDFVGDTEFTIDNSGPYTARGHGSRSGDSVRFYEKDEAGRGRDIRIWRIVRGANGTFTAEHATSW